jgi:hypothetical protein
MKSSTDKRHLCIPGLTAWYESTSDGSQLESYRGSLCLSEEITCRHGLILGKPGSGKTLRVLDRMAFAAIRRQDCSVLFIDPQGVEAKRIISYAQHVRGKDSNIIYINPCDASRSSRVNLIEGVTDEDKAGSIARTLLEASGKPGFYDTPYWRSQAVLKLTLLIRAINKTQRGKGTLGQVREVVDEGSDAIEQLGQRANLKALAEFGRNTREGSNAQTVLTEVANALLPWSSKAVRQTTSSNDFSFDSMADKPSVMVLTSSSESETVRMRGFFNVIQLKFFDWAVERSQLHGGELPLPLYVFIDELSLLGRIIDFELRLNTIRKKRVSVWCATQTLGQIDSAYGAEATAIKAGLGSIIAVPALDGMDGVYLSSRSGTVEGSQIATNASGVVAGMNRFHRPLLLAEEITSPPPDSLGPRMLFAIAGRRWFLGHLEAAYQNKEEAPFLDTSGELTLPARQPDEGDSGNGPDELAEDEIEKRLRQIEEELVLCGADPDASAYWREFCRHNSGTVEKKRMVLDLAEGLWQRHANATAFLNALKRCGSWSVKVALAYMDYQLALKNAKGSLELAKPIKDSKPIFKKSSKCKDHDHLMHLDGRQTEDTGGWEENDDMPF